MQAFAPLATWSAAGHPTGGAWDVVAVAGPAMFAAALLVLIARAIVRHGRYRVVRTFTDEDREAVRAAVAAAERRTVGEILPVVVERSDEHPAGLWRAALTFALVGSSLLIAWLPWDRPVWLLAGQIALGALGYGLARLLPDLQRTFVLERRAAETAAEQAFQEFFGNGLYRTRAATGVLLFVSLFERRTVVLADEGIDGTVEKGFWEGVDEAVLAGIRRGSLRDGLVDAIAKAGDALSERFPWAEGDRNEIPDRIIVRRD